MKKIIGYHVLLLAVAALFARCDGNNPVAPGVLKTIRLTLDESTIEVGQRVETTVTAFDRTGATITAAPASYASDAPTIAAIHATTGAVFGIAPGTTQVTATIQGKSDRKSVTVLMGALRINEIKADGNGPLGWVELFNPSTAPVALGGWRITSSDLLNHFVLPAGDTIAAGGYYVIDEKDFASGLNASDEVHLFSRFGVQVDSYAWITPAVSYGRCPDGTGAFVSVAQLTRAKANTCPQYVR
jgi:Lamin Tail Domain